MQEFIQKHLKDAPQMYINHIKLCDSLKEDNKAQILKMSVDLKFSCILSFQSDRVVAMTDPALLF